MVEKAQLEARNAKQRENIAQLQAKLEAKSEELSACEEKCSGLETQCATLKDKCVELSREASLRSNENETLERTNEWLQQRLDEAIDSLSASENKCNNLATEKRELETRQITLSNDKALLEEQVEAAKQERDAQVQAAIEKSEHDKKELLSRIEEHKKKVASVETEFNKLTARWKQSMTWKREMNAGTTAARKTPLKESTNRPAPQQRKSGVKKPASAVSGTAKGTTPIVRRPTFR